MAESKDGDSAGEPVVAVPRGEDDHWPEGGGHELFGGFDFDGDADLTDGLGFLNAGDNPTAPASELAVIEGRPAQLRAADGSPLFDQTDQVTPGGFESEISASLVAAMIHSVSGEVAGEIQDPDLQSQMPLDEALILVYATGDSDRDAVAAVVSALEADVILDAGQEALLLDVTKTTDSAELLQAIMTRLLKNRNFDILKALWVNALFISGETNSPEKNCIKEKFGNFASDQASIAAYFNLMLDESYLRTIRDKCKANRDGSYLPNDDRIPFYFRIIGDSLNLCILGCTFDLNAEVEPATLTEEISIAVYAKDPEYLRFLCKGFNRLSLHMLLV